MGSWTAMLDHLRGLPPGAELLVASYLLVLLALGVLGAHRLRLLRIASRAAAPAAPPPLPGPELPLVTIQLPLYNERNVVERLLRAVAEIDWPRDRLEIQVLDDSTDDTTVRVARLLPWLRGQGLAVEHLRRPRRQGFKAGALAEGLRRARGELIAIFDADFVPGPRFLRDLAGHFADPEVGMVQVRWEHLNRRQGLLTQIQAVLLDGHFLIEQTARAAAGRFFNFNGTAGVWRRAAIEGAGGWASDTLTEDLDLSYRAQLRGWRFVYRSDLSSPAELPADLNAFKGQQNRWAKGSAQALRKLLPAILTSPLSPCVRLEALFHLAGNFGYPLLLALALLVWPAIELRYRAGWHQSLLVDLPFFCLGFLSLIAFYARPLSRTGLGPRRWLLLAALMALGIGMSVSNSRAVLAGLLGHKSPFRRTPKRGSAAPRDAYPIRGDLGALLEVGLGVLFVSAFACALKEGLWPSLPFLGLFAAGFLGTGIASVRLRLRPRTAASRRARGAGSIRAVSGGAASTRVHCIE